MNRDEAESFYEDDIPLDELNALLERGEHPVRTEPTVVAIDGPSFEVVEDTRNIVMFIESGQPSPASVVLAGPAFSSRSLAVPADR